MIEHRYLFSDTHGIVPGQHDDHRAELDVRGAAGEIAQILQHVGTHRVVREMVLHAPDRVEAERLGEIAKLEFVTVNVVIRPPGIGGLENQPHSDLHASLQRSRCGKPSAAPLVRTNLPRGIVESCALLKAQRRSTLPLEPFVVFRPP